MPQSNAPRIEDSTPKAAAPQHFHKVALVTTVVLLALWGVLTVLARPLAPRVAEVVLAAEFAVGADVSRGEREE